MGSKICAVTGATGFVGGEISTVLESHNWQIRQLNRTTHPGSSQPAFTLGQKVPPELFCDVEALVHCAYDFTPRKWQRILDVNVDGTNELFLAARKAGVRTIVLISSLSAFPGCRSLYGRSKLRAENLARSVSAHVLRPGLTYSKRAGGMFGRLSQQVRTGRFVPVLWGGRQTQYLIHAEDLGQLVLACLHGRVPADSPPIAAAHEQGWELRDILSAMAQAPKRQVHFFPIPWPLVWLGLRTLEMAGWPTKFRSDSLLGLVYQNSRPDFSALKRLGINCRPFRLAG
jgi:nucleoside-diphosphate-sugar epimerase